MSIVTVVLQHNLGADGLLLIQYTPYFRYIEFYYTFDPPNPKKSSMWPPAEKVWRPLL